MYICQWNNDCKMSKEGDDRGVMVIVVGNGHGDMSSNPGRDPWDRYESNYSPSSYG